MAYEIDKKTGEITISGFEQGIAPSPHKGIANIQNGNISTELGEVMASFNRFSQITSTGTTPFSGTLTASGGDGNFVLASSFALSLGQWINVTAATVTIPKTSETVNIVGIGAGAGGGGANSSVSTGAGGGGGAGQFIPNNALNVTVAAYTVTVGLGGTGGTTSGTNGVSGGVTSVTHISGAIIATDLSALGGGGGAGKSSGTGSNGVSGASGGGASGAASAPGTGGAATAGNAGGNAANGGAGGGGGSGAVGSVGTASTGGAGGIGTASTISGASVTYAAGGGGGGTGTGGTGGVGGGGTGSSAVGNGTNATANTGSGGGGGTSTGGGTGSGGNGADGTVIIAYPTGNITATGGSITTSGGNTIHTFTTSGTFTISAINTTQTLPTGSYFIDSSASAGTKVKIATSYDPNGANPLFHGTSGTITFTTLGQFAKPVAKATETYNTSTQTQYRYYVLDNTGLVWVNDSVNSFGWILTNPSITYYGSQAVPSGLAVLNGWVLVFAGEEIFAKPTTNLGTAWTEITGDKNNNLGTSTVPHFAFVGHQGRCYYADGNYIGSIFPDTSIQTGGANIQSFSAYTAPDTQHGVITAILSGSGPQIPIGSSYSVPVVFFTDDFGTLPTAVTAGAIYWLSLYNATTGSFLIAGAPTSSTLSTSNTPGAGDTSATLSAPWTGQTFIQPVLFSNGDVRNALFTNGSTIISWSTALTGTSTTTITLGSSRVDLKTGASGNQYFNTFSPISSSAGSQGVLATMTLSNQRLNLPAFEIAQCMTEIGNTMIIGCKGNVLYPWNQSDATPSSIITLPESDTSSLLTVNQMAYAFSGHKGNVYITDGSVATQVTKVPDYSAGIPGSPATYIEPYYTWGDSMYVRGRIYFSILDQTTSKTGNCGGVWSFIPTQNFYIGQDVGLALRLENQNSYATYNGVATVLLKAENQSAGNPLYWSGWWSDITGTTYGIDYSNTGTNSGFTTIIETDAIPVGTMLGKKTFSQIEYKLSSPLDSGAVMSMKYRANLTDSWRSAGILTKDQPSLLSGYFTVDFEKGQWLQLQATITPITSTAVTNTFVRLNEIRVR